MQRVQIQFSAEQLQALQSEASASNRALAAIVREAVDAWISGRQRRQRLARALEEVGGFRSGLGDLAENHDRYLDQNERP